VGITIKSSKFKEIIETIQHTQPGQERNMYSSIKELFVQTLGYPSKDIFIDVAGENSRAIPDLTVKLPLKQLPAVKSFSLDWIVIEAKDEAGVFLNSESRERIYNEKKKYIKINTAYFVMVDPYCLIIRKVVFGKEPQPNSDIIIELRHITEEEFKKKTAFINAEQANTMKPLAEFRDGDTTRIASIKLNGEPTRIEFYDVLRKCTHILQSACYSALSAHTSEMEEIKSIIAEFEKEYEGYELTIRPFHLQGAVLGSVERKRQHDKDVSKTKRAIMKNLPISKLALEDLPNFKKRTAAKDEDIDLLFTIETANLILARVLMLRFFEDHGFFGHKKYVCNGGVAAFQKMMSYFDLGYTRLLQQAYAQASHLYKAIFDETELDWVFGSNDKQLSFAIELTMYYLSMFDFKTIKGDILTGVYDRFLEGSRRKQLGEYYTPPSIARYIVDRIGLKINDKVLDPACGSGTFLIEAYQRMVGELVDKGIAGYEEAIKALANIAGNDINSFSSMIAQIQMLWHILVFDDELKEEGFPELRITEKANSLVQQSMDTQSTPFFELDRSEYDAVIGNPPYVRVERLKQSLDHQTIQYFEREISSKINLYGLFLYRGLESWCKKPCDGNTPGKLGFIVPLSFCDSEELADLRKLFKVGKKWRIVEIVDMETIAPYVFDAAVNPIVIIAENRPATADDIITIKIADEKCVIFHDEERIHYTFNLSKASCENFTYGDIFTTDGRILTKLTQKRLLFIKHMERHKQFKDIVKNIWIKKKGARIVKWSSTEPTGDDSFHWEAKSLLTRGAVFRGKKVSLPDNEGYDVYKGENVAACTIEGNPQEHSIDVDKMDDPSVWRFRNILPAKGYAFQRICLTPTCTSFNPEKLVFLDTTTLFFPEESLIDFPFDLLVLSRIYRYHFGIALRMGMVEELWCDMYPANLKLMPWTENLRRYSLGIESLRQPFLDACKSFYQRSNYILEKLKDLPAVLFKELANSKEEIRIKWSDSFKKSSSLITLSHHSPQIRGNSAILFVGANLLDWIEINDTDIATRLSNVLNVFEGDQISKAEILDLPIPVNKEAEERFNQIVDESKNKDKMDDVLDELDQYVAEAFEIAEEDLMLIKTEMKNDNFLKRLKPNLPFTGKRKRGLLSGLDQSNRYQ